METVFFVITVLGALGGIAGFVAVLPEIRRLRLRKLNRPRLYRFNARTPEALWESFREVHEQRFPNEEIADSYVDIRRWIDEWTEARKHPLHEMEEILLARCVQSQVRSYVYAQYYHTWKLAFISYIATDKRAKEAVHEDMGEVLGGLLRIIRTYDPKWKAIIGELEETRIVFSQGKRRKQRHAELLFTIFLHSAQDIKEKSGIVVPVYSLKFPYYQPVLRPEEVPADGSIVLTDELKQWILYVPNGPESLIRKRGKTFVEKARAVEVLEFLFLRLYRDAFLSPKYQVYLRSALAHHVGLLNAEVELATNPLEAAGRES